jgi:hypothetical protein
MRIDELHELALILVRLKQRFPALDPVVIELALRLEHQRFDGRPIRDFVPLLVERGVAEQLRDHRRHEPDRRPEVDSEQEDATSEPEASTPDLMVASPSTDLVMREIETRIRP